ncbi:hypothetical protein [Paraburkholderia caribensis]|uniref:hypothetical protein n=1 Tax=Paraburkholderia caribensis TaxID=75105 RepID=UPI001CC8285C|nr:hypothetical protein [Paraburkholderia caribensis]
MRELPLRTESALRKRREILQLSVRRMYGTGIVIRGTTQTIWKALKGKPCTREELAARAGVCSQSVTAFIKENRSRIHVCTWRKPAGKYVEVFKAGAGIDAPKPPPKPRSQTYADWWQRLKRDRPDVAGHRIARDNHRRDMRSGKLVRRDPAAVAIFGPAARGA